MKFADKVKKGREDKNLSQKQLADLINVSVRTVQNYEISGMHPKQRNIYGKLAEIFDVDINYLLTEDEELIFQAYEKGGVKTMREVEDLVSGVCGLFAGGAMPEEDMDAAMKAISDAYFAVKAENKKIYSGSNKKQA